jgi:hypothetical protein
MEQLNAMNEIEIDKEQLAVEEPKALFQPTGKTPRTDLAVKVENKEESLFFAPFRGEMIISLN